MEVSSFGNRQIGWKIDKLMRPFAPVLRSESAVFREGKPW